jgi:hypothetical protein
MSLDYSPLQLLTGDCSYFFSFPLAMNSLIVSLILALVLIGMQLVTPVR